MELFFVPDNPKLDDRVYHSGQIKSVEVLKSSVASIVKRAYPSTVAFAIIGNIKHRPPAEQYGPLQNQRNLQVDLVGSGH